MNIKLHHDFFSVDSKELQHVDAPVDWMNHSAGIITKVFNASMGVTLAMNNDCVIGFGQRHPTAFLMQPSISMTLGFIQITNAWASEDLEIPMIPCVQVPYSRPTTSNSIV